MATTQNPSRQNRPAALIRPAGLVRPGIAAAPLPKVELEPRTIADFLNSMWCTEITELLPEDQAWLEKARAEMGAELGPTSLAMACIECVSELGRLVNARPDIEDSADLVAAVDSLADDELKGYLFQELAESTDYGDITRKALAGDATAWEDLKSQLLAHKGHAVLAGDLADVPQAVRKLVHAWLPRFQEVEPRIGQMLIRDVNSRSMEEAARDPLGFVENATNGIRVTPERGLRRVTLTPSYFSRPFNTVSRMGDSLVIYYPITDAAVGSSSRMTPSAATVRLYRALGDETRLRILRLLVDQDRYLTELANELELSKPTVSHHLAQLRVAGLVTVVEEGHLTFYSLRRDRVSDAGPELSAFLAQ